MKNNLIIGAGISGVSAAAYFEKNGVKGARIIEKSDKIGGRIQTISKENTLVEVGAQYLAATDIETLKLVREISPKLVYPHTGVKATFIYDGKKSGVPIDLFLKINPLKTLQIIRGIIKTTTINTKQEMLCEQFFPEWYIDNFGEDTLWFFGGIIQATTTPYDKISAWNGINVLQAMFSTPYSVHGGLTEMVKTISSHLKQTKINYNEGVKKIGIDGDEVTKILTTSGKEINHIDNIVSTINANQLREIVPDKEYKLLDKVSYSTCSFVYFETKKPILNYNENVAFSDLSSPIISILNRSTQSKFQYGLLTIDSKLCSLSDDKLIRKIIGEAAHALPIVENEIISTKIFKWNNALPILNPELHLIQPELQKLPIKNLFLAGDYTTFPSMEGAVVSAKQTVQKIVNSVPVSTK